MTDLQELYKLKDSLVKQSDILFDKIKEVSDEINELLNYNKDALIKKYPYYKDKNSILYITKRNSIEFVVTKIVYKLHKVVGITTFASNNIDFLNSFKPTTKEDWNNAILRLNEWLLDANVKLVEINN